MRKCKSLGMTLLEVLLTLSLLMILSNFALGAYTSLVTRMRVHAATSELHSGLLYARAEAIKHGGNVIICRSVSTHEKMPSCDGTGIDSQSNSGWGDGWLIFHDANADGEVSESDTLLGVQGKLFSTPEQGAIVPSPNRKLIRFNAFGQVYGTFMQFAVLGSKTGSPQSLNRYICIASGGRARVDTKLCNGKIK